MADKPSAADRLKALEGKALAAIADTGIATAWHYELAAIRAEVEAVAREIQMPPLGRGVMELKAGWADRLAGGE